MHYVYIVFLSRGLEMLYFAQQLENYQPLRYLRTACYLWPLMLELCRLFLCIGRIYIGIRCHVLVCPGITGQPSNCMA